MASRGGRVLEVPPNDLRCCHQPHHTRKGQEHRPLSHHVAPVQCRDRPGSCDTAYLPERAFQEGLRGLPLSHHFREQRLLGSKEPTSRCVFVPDMQC